MLAGLLKKLNHDPIVFLKGQPMGKPARLKYVGLARQMFNLDQPRQDEALSPGGVESEFEPEFETAPQSEACEPDPADRK